ncbi:FAD-dependent oxidoreductase [Chloroflexota bacterium]
MTLKEALDEATRCLLCEDPECVKGCPAGVDVPGFVRRMHAGNMYGAIKILRWTNPLPDTCALVCPTEELCQKNCKLIEEAAQPLKIGELQHFVADYEKQLRSPVTFIRNPKTEKVAVLGGGAAGLACAAKLATMGYRVTILEKGEQPGGTMYYYIPPYRLDREVILREIEAIKDYGVEINTEADIRDLDELFEQGYDAIFVGTGASQSAKIGLPGEEAEGFYLALDFLRQTNERLLNQQGFAGLGNRVLVIGGGNVAVDCAMSSMSLGAKEVEMICLEGPNEMPAWNRGRNETWEKGIIIHHRYMPKEILVENGRVAGLRAVQIRWKEPDKYVPSNAEEIPGTEITLRADTIIEAVGQRVSDEVRSLLPGVEFEGGLIKIDPDTLATTREGVYAGGDVVSGGGTVVGAVADGIQAALSIRSCLEAKHPEANPPEVTEVSGVSH